MDYSKLLPFETPLVFADGTAYWNKITEQYRTHKRGFFILGPSGSGKTHFVKNQTEPHWIDGDVLWCGANAAPAGQWWLRSGEDIIMIDSRSDVVTQQAKSLGLWIVGASNYWLKPDAIVIPHWSTHQKYIRYRETHNYDGGAKSDAFAQVLWHRRWIMKYAKQGVPQFRSVQEAAAYLEKLERQS
ncbi:MAG TPA: hypothetical protein VIM53_02935 [Candidatus Saccharimonadales bacterium]